MKPIHYLAGVVAGITVLAGVAVGSANSQMYMSEEEMIRAMELHGQAEWLLPSGETYCDKSCGGLKCCGGGMVEPI